MAQVINTNIASLSAQRQLNKSQSSLNTSLQRLSSGMRINSAKDDAAGLAISERFTAQIRGLNQAVRNSNDGISLAQTAESSLGEVTNNLQRVRELAIQSANATNSASDRTALQQEVAQLIGEIDRVAKQSNFNGVSLLDGSFANQTFQVGANVGDTINVTSIVDSTAVGLGIDNGTASATGTALTAALSAGDLTINGNDVGAVAQDSSLIAAAINAADSTVTATSTASTTGALTAVTLGGTQADTEFLTMDVDGVTINSAARSGTDLTLADMDTAIAGATLSTGMTYTGTLAGDDLVFTKADGSSFSVSTLAFNTGSGTVTGDTATTGRGTVNLSSAADIVIAGTDATKAGLTAGTLTKSANTLNVLDVGGAEALISAVDTALETVNGTRATLGAVQNRFESVVTSLQTSAESLSSARSRIQDTDFAAETANLTKAQILQQAGMAMMSQANSLPQNVLSLLGG